MATSRTRARDSDRDALCRALDTAFAEGQLDGAEHRERTATALRARTLGELRDLAEDLQLTDPTPEIRSAPARKPRSRWFAAVAALVLLGGAFAIGRATAPSGPVATDEQVAADGGPVADVEKRVVRLEGLHTPEGFTRFVADVRERFGTTVVADAVLYPGYAVLTTPIPGNAGRTESWYYRGGVDGPNGTGTREADEPLVDLGAFDPAVLLPLVAGAPETLLVPDATQRYVSISDDGTGPQASVYASNAFSESGYLTARPDGSVVTIHPHEPR